jgi:hypothetical protein
VPLLNCSNEGATYAFFNMVLSRLGVLAKLSFDQGTKFHGEFQKLCESSFINHCITL